MDISSTPPAAQARPAVSREDALLGDAGPLAAQGDDRKDPAPLDFAALMRRVEAEVYDIT
jgi:hypothetical protein